MAEEFKLKVRRSTEESINDKILRGDSLLRSRRYAEALDVFNEAVAISPENSRSYIFVTQALIALKQYDEALNCISKALELNPVNPLIYLTAGQAESYLENWDKALAHFQTAAQMEPRSASAYNGMGHALHALQRYDEAINMFRQALKHDPSYTKIYAGIAKAYLAKQDEDDGMIHVDTTDVLEIIDRSANISVVEEDDLSKIFGTTTNEEIKERISDLEYFTTWLGALLEEFHWQLAFLKKAINSSGSYIIPEGMEEGFEHFYSDD